MPPNLNVYFIPFQEWIVRRDYGALWESIPKCPTTLNIKEWFRESVLFAGRRQYLMLNGVIHVDWSLSANCGAAKLGCPMNHWVIYSTAPLLSLEIDFIQGLYGRISANEAGLVSKVDYNKNGMVYEINGKKIKTVYIDYKGIYEISQ